MPTYPRQRLAAVTRKANDIREDLKGGYVVTREAMKEHLREYNQRIENLRKECRALFADSSQVEVASAEEWLEESLADSVDLKAQIKKLLNYSESTYGSSQVSNATHKSGASRASSRRSHASLHSNTSGQLRRK